MNDLPNFFEPAIVTSTDDPEDKGRVKARYHKNDLVIETWIPLVDSVFSSGDNGWDGQLAVNDNILIAFVDWPSCQKPFVSGKPKSASQTRSRAQKETLRVKDHVVEFSESEVTISNKNDQTRIVIKDGEIDIQTNGTSPYTLVRSENLKSFIENLFVIGNLGFPTTTVQLSGYLWNPEISSDNAKVS